MLDWLPQAVTDRTLVAVLLVVGLLGVALELANPGELGPGMVGAVCLLLAAMAVSRESLSPLGVVLLALGALMVGVDQLGASDGWLSGLGAATLVVGAVLLFEPSHLGTLLGVGAALVAVLLGFSAVVARPVRDMVRRPPVTGREALVHAVGIARTDLRPGKEGLIAIEGELWRAEAPAASVSAGERVVVIQAAEGLLLRVQPAAPAPATLKARREPRQRLRQPR